MNASLVDEIPDVIRLTAGEKTRLVELEAIVERHLEGFLATGAALCEIRSKRLYRTQYPTFEVYVQQRWGLPRSRANEIVHSFECAELLLRTTGAVDSKTPLPANVPEGVMRSISKLSGDELRAQAWRLISTLSCCRGTSLRSAAYQISHMVREAIREADPGGAKNGQQENGSRKAPKAIFVRSIVQLSHSSGFDPQLCILHLRSEQEAATVYQACQLIATRCSMVQELLHTRFPEIRCLPAPSNA